MNRISRNRIWNKFATLQNMEHKPCITRHILANCWPIFPCIAFHPYTNSSTNTCSIIEYCMSIVFFLFSVLSFYCYVSLSMSVCPFAAAVAKKDLYTGVCQFYQHFRSQWPWPSELKFAPLVTLVLCYVSTKLDVSMDFLYQENQRQGTDRQKDGWTHGWKDKRMGYNT